jgi:hypothetical protein
LSTYLTFYLKLFPLSALAILWSFGGSKAAAETPQNELKQ